MYTVDLLTGVLGGPQSLSLHIAGGENDSLTPAAQSLPPEDSHSGDVACHRTQDNA
jgi:hypothetical protein